MEQVTVNQGDSADKQTPNRYDRFTDRDKRFLVRLRARVRQPATDLEVSVMITNLSRSGCKIDTMIALSPTSPVILSYPGLPAMRASIMWSKTGAHGCKFDAPIPPETLEQLIAV